MAGGLLQEKMNIPCVSNSNVAELMRGVRRHIDTLLGSDVPTSVSCPSLLRKENVESYVALSGHHKL